jgi:hypothetical protein
VSRALDVVGTAEFPRFMRLRIAERQEASLAREGKNTCRLRTLFYGAAARLGFRTTKTQTGLQRAAFAAMHGPDLLYFWFVIVGVSP